MITRLMAAIIGLLAFAGMILVGLATGNPFETVLIRALWGLAGGLAVGHVAGHIGGRIIHEHFAALVDKDTQAELATARPAGTAAPGQNPAAEIQDANKEASSDSRQQEGPTKDQTLSVRAARLMPGPLGDPVGET